MGHDLKELSKKAGIMSKYGLRRFDDYIYTVCERLLAYDIIIEAQRRAEFLGEKITSEYIATHRRELLKSFAPKLADYIWSLVEAKSLRDNPPLLDKFFDEMPWDDVNKFELERREAV